jgi:hypothetical protein
MLENYAFSGTPHTPISYIDQGTKLTCQCGYEWIENRFPEYAVCPRCDRRQMERDSSRNLVQSSTSANPLSSSSSTNKQIDEILDLLNFGTIDPMVIE